MTEQECEILENELKKNTEILDNTFERFNLKVLSIAFSGSVFNNHISLYVELTTLSGNKIKIPRNSYSDDVKVKVNFYENGNLLCSDSTKVGKDEFGGYDTVEVSTSYANIVSRATSARIFAAI